MALSNRIELDDNCYMIDHSKTFVSQHGIKYEYFDSRNNYHREDGPAVIYGNNTELFYLNGHRCSKRLILDRIYQVNLKKIYEE